MRQVPCEEGLYLAGLLANRARDVYSVGAKMNALLTGGGEPPGIARSRAMDCLRAEMNAYIAEWGYVHEQLRQHRGAAATVAAGADRSPQPAKSDPA